MKKTCCSVKSVKLFINISGFSSFFSVSPKRSDLLRTVCGRAIPKTVETRWNFHSRVVNTVFNNKDALLQCLDKIQNEDGWDDVTIRETIGLANLLHYGEFLYCCHFLIPFLHVDILYNTIQKLSANALYICTAIQHFETAFNVIRNNLPELYACARFPLSFNARYVRNTARSHN
jgi:hypothetical protein